VNGSYSVKSAYSLCTSLAAEPIDVGLDRNWNMIWKMHVPHKVQSFLCRVGHSCLPTRTWLNQRGVHCEDSCVSYAVMAETHMHIFFVCPKATECWDLVQLGTMMREMLGNTNDFNTFLFDFLSRLSSQQQLAAMILWSLWKNRNSKLWDNVDCNTLNPTYHFLIKI